MAWLYLAAVLLLGLVNVAECSEESLEEVEQEELEGVDTEEESAEVEVEESQDVSSEETLEYESIMSSRDFRVSICAKTLFVTFLIVKQASPETTLTTS